MMNVMLDLETMGKGPNAAIVAIGAVAFDPETCTVDAKRGFYRGVDLESCVQYRLQMDASTVLWWLQQSEQARQALTEQPGLELHDALDQFGLWCTQQALAQDLLVWGNGAAFDNVILRNAYQEAGLPTPWSHWNDRCYRTVKAMAPSIKIERSGTHHHALDDAISQAKHLVRVLTLLKGGAA